MPFGILNVASSELSVYFGQSAETSDFIVDCLLDWWQAHHSQYPDIRELAIDASKARVIYPGTPMSFILALDNKLLLLFLSTKPTLLLAIPIYANNLSISVKIIKGAKSFGDQLAIAHKGEKPKKLKSIAAQQF